MNTQKYLSKDNILDIFIVPKDGYNHISIYSSSTKKSVCYDADSVELKRLADFLYSTIRKNAFNKWKKILCSIFTRQK